MNKPSTAARNTNARMTHEEAQRLARAYQANPHSAFYRSISETTGKERPLARDVVLHVLTSRGLLPAVAA